MGTFDFAVALTRLKAGHRVARQGWNGHGMFVYLVPGAAETVTPGSPLANAFPAGTSLTRGAYLMLKTAGGDLIPWLASQADLLADDWIELI